MHEHQLHVDLNQLRALLVPSWTEHDTYEAQLASYRDLLAQTFGKDNIQTTLSDLKSKKEYSQWRKTRQSCILRLSGHTSTHHTGLCWLSGIIPGLMDIIRGEGQHVVFHLTQRQHYMPEEAQEVSMREIVSSIIFQLLQLMSQRLRNRKQFDELYQMLNKGTWSADLKSMCRMLVTVLEEFEEMNIILDRIDRATCTGRAPRFVEKLLETLSTSKSNTRILLVTNPAFAMDWDIELSDDMRRKDMYLEIAEWDQEVITPRRRKQR